MRTRPLKSEEYQHLLHAFTVPKAKLKQRVWDSVCVSTFISIPLFVLFVTISVLAEKRTVPDALRRGVPVLFIAPVFFLLPRIGTRVPNPFAPVHEDIKA